MRRWPYRKLYLAEWLEVLGHSQTDAAEVAGVGQSYISNIIAGRRPNPSTFVLLRLSEWLGITVNDLFEPPPDDAIVKAIRGLSPGAHDALMRKPPRR
jgi:transcriptional regulator with XRE-family HTH domain